MSSKVATTDYVSLLRDPRWQKKRLEVMDRDNWRCVACGRPDQMLHVHHIAYTNKPWEAPLSDLQTLCERCHDELGKHPKGGPYYVVEMDEYEPGVGDTHLKVAYRHCPLCGCSRTDCHSGCVIFVCECDSPKSPRWVDSMWQADTCSGDPAYVCSLPDQYLCK